MPSGSADLGDLHKVWEVKPLKKAGEDEARRILQSIAKQVQPIMRKHKWRLKILSEFCPSNARLLGVNQGGGSHVKLRLRRHDRISEFLPYEQVLDTMLHELCHNVHGPHNASFYNLWDAPLALACGACGAIKANGGRKKFKIWTCKFCTLENKIELEKCSACMQWRYSYGPPVSIRGPNNAT